MATRILLRRDTAANWTSNDPVLASGEEGYETDSKKRKVGNGTDKWSDLTYEGGTGLELLDEDDFASDSDTKAPSQQSVKAYVAANAGGQLLDEDDMASDSATKGATQQSIKAYVDNKAPTILDEDDMVSDDATKPPSQQSVKAYVAANKLVLVDEDDMVSDDATKVPSQQSVKAYVDTKTVLLDEDDFSSDSATKAPTQQSVKAYVADAVSGGMAYKGSYDADTNTPNLDDSPAAGAIKLGDTYTVTVDGTFYATNVTVGNTLMAEKDDPTAEGDWTIVNRANISAASVSNDASGNLTSTKVQDALVELQGDIDTINADSTTAGSIDKKIADVMIDEDDMASDSDVKVPTQQSVKAYVGSRNAVTALYTATAGQTEFNIANTAGTELTVIQEGFVVDPADYDRDAAKITLHTGADANEQVYIVAYNG